MIERLEPPFLDLYAATWARIQSLATTLRATLWEIPGVTVRDTGAEQCGIVTFTVDGQQPAALAHALLGRGINVSHTTVAGTRPDMEARGLTAMVRASVHYYNSEAEIARFCETLRRLV
jgi:cysteine desulfurase/selenocysteine lyase